jgi:outer membrane protein insertion porin family
LNNKNITLRIKGGIGNQLFIFSFLIYLQKKYKLNIYIDFKSGYQSFLGGNKFKQKFLLNKLNYFFLYQKDKYCFLGFFGKIKVSDPNFFGYGVDTHFEAQKGLLMQNIDFGLGDAHFFGYRVGAGFDIFRSYNDKKALENYEDNKFGMSTYVRYFLSDNIFQKFGYTLYNQEIKILDSSKAARFLLDQASKGAPNISEASLSTTFDKRDNPMDPSSGYVVSLNNSFAGIGGDISYLKNELKMAVHFPITEKIVLNLRGRGGLTFGGIVFGDTLRVVDHFQLGQDSFYGFDTWGIGPRILSKKDSGIRADALGGTKYYTGTAEISIPVGGPELGIRFLAYTQFGDLWDCAFQKKATDKFSFANENYVRVSAGLGVGVTVPFLGRIRLDYAWPVRKTYYDNEGNFCFGMDLKF